MHKIKNKEIIKQLYTPPIKEVKYPSLTITEPNDVHEIDILHFTNDNGYKYILSLVDVHNSIAEARPLKNKSIPILLTQLEDIYQKSHFLDHPNCLQADNAFNNKEFKLWCDRRGINYKFAEKYQHRQMAHVERLNQMIGKYLWTCQLDEEIETNQPVTTWVKNLPIVINEINQKRKLHKKMNKPKIGLKTNPKTNYLIENNTKVRLKVNDPEDLQGRKLPGTIRSADIKWKYSPIYIVKESFMMSGKPILYKIETEDGKEFKSLVTAEQLQIM